MARQRARRIDNLNQPLKRNILVAVGRQIARAHTTNQLAEARIARRVRAQNQRVDEKPDQIIQRSVGASRNRAANRNVAAAAKPRQQRRKPSLQHHEQARTARPRQLQQRPVQLTIQPHFHPAPAVAGNRRPNSVARQRYLIRKLVQPLAPEPKLARNRALPIRLRTQNQTLPQRVVGILHRQRRKRRRTSLPPRPVGSSKIARQRRQRPPVPGNVMQHKQQYMLARPKLKQMRTQRRIARKIKPTPRRSR